MRGCDALIVGGGPAGSTCARALTLAGWNVVVVDRARFPRHKVCAGWLTPEVFDLLALRPEQYRADGGTLAEITGFRTSVIDGPVATVRYGGVVSYAVRRREFDDYLLRRTDATVRDGTPVASIERRRDRWVVNDAFSAPVLVGAGGHFCPVARHVGAGAARARPVIAQAAEFQLADECDGVESAVPQLFFCADFDGYGWCVRKGDYLNVGIGRRHAAQFGDHRDAFASFLERTGKVRRARFARWLGHAYLAAGAGARPLAGDGLLLIGDAAGLAYAESGEGIGPAIESGAAAARVLIAAEGKHSIDALEPYADVMRHVHPPVPPPRPTSRVRAAVGRALLGVEPFARHVVLDRWFLRRSPRRDC